MLKAMSLDRRDGEPEKKRGFERVYELKACTDGGGTGTPGCLFPAKVRAYVGFLSCASRFSKVAFCDLFQSVFPVRVFRCR